MLLQQSMTQGPARPPPGPGRLPARRGRALPVLPGPERQPAQPEGGQHAPDAPVRDERGFQLDPAGPWAAMTPALGEAAPCVSVLSDGRETGRTCARAKVPADSLSP